MTAIGADERIAATATEVPSREKRGFAPSLGAVCAQIVVLVAAFIVINVLIGIVLTSMEEARELERRRRLSFDHEPPLGDVAPAPVMERIAILRAALDELEQELAVAGKSLP